MEEKKSEGMPSGAEALGNICTALVVFSMIPMMLGLIDSTAIIGLLCWMVPCFVFVIIAVTLMLKEGNIAGACLTATMTGVLLCNLVVRAIVVLSFMLAGAEIPAAVTASFSVISAGGFITGAVFLIGTGLANIKAQNKVPGTAMLAAAAGFILMAIGGLISNLLTLIGFIILALVVVVLFLGAIKTVAAYIFADRKP